MRRLRLNFPTLPDSVLQDALDASGGDHVGATALLDRRGVGVLGHDSVSGRSRWTGASSDLTALGRRVGAGTVAPAVPRSPAVGTALPRQPRAGTAESSSSRGPIAPTRSRWEASGSLGSSASPSAPPPRARPTQGVGVFGSSFGVDRGTSATGSASATPAGSNISTIGRLGTTQPNRFGTEYQFAHERMTMNQLDAKRRTSAHRPASAGPGSVRTGGLGLGSPLGLEGSRFSSAISSPTGQFGGLGLLDGRTHVAPPSSGSVLDPYDDDKSLSEAIAASLRTKADEDRKADEDHLAQLKASAPAPAPAPAPGNSDEEALLQAAIEASIKTDEEDRAKRKLEEEQRLQEEARQREAEATRRMLEAEAANDPSLSHAISLSLRTEQEERAKRELQQQKEVSSASQSTPQASSIGALQLEENSSVMWPEDMPSLGLPTSPCSPQSTNSPFGKWGTWEMSERAMERGKKCSHAFEGEEAYRWTEGRSQLNDKLEWILDGNLPKVSSTLEEDGICANRLRSITSPSDHGSSVASTSRAGSKENCRPVSQESKHPAESLRITFRSRAEVRQLLDSCTADLSVIEDLTLGGETLKYGDQVLMSGSELRALWTFPTAINVRRQRTEASHEGRIEGGRKLLRKRVGAADLSIQEVAEDGNCQFRAVALQLFGAEDHHPLIRHVAVAHIADSQEEYSAYLADGELPTYLQQMARSRTWGDELTLRAITDVLGVKIHVVTSDEKHWYLLYTPKGDGKTPAAGRQLFLGYVSPVHYDAINSK